MGFAWGGIYRTLLVSSIVTTSFRNEGHFRAGERIGGTSDFFRGRLRSPGHLQSSTRSFGWSTSGTTSPAS